MNSDTEPFTHLVIEAFYGGSHKQLTDLLCDHLLNGKVCKCTLPAKKWHWRARTSALYFAQNIPYNSNFRVLICSSVLNLSELVALRPDLSKLEKIVYFHENQLVYPVRKQQDRDFQYGYNQIVSSMVADKVLFNSNFNMESFLKNISTFLKLIPDNRPKGIAELIRPKCSTLYFPIVFDDMKVLLETPDIPSHSVDKQNSEVAIKKVKPDDDVSIDLIDAPREGSNDTKKTSTKLHIVWPHRWEHDKNPELFFQTLIQLSSEGFDFNASVLGETFTDVPAIFEEAKEKLQKHIIHWGYLPSKRDYYKVLQSADIVVSTAVHEFFGVAIFGTCF